LLALLCYSSNRCSDGFVSACADKAACSLLYLGYTVATEAIHGGCTLTTHGGGVRVSVTAEGHSLLIWWRDHDSGRLAAAAVSALRQALCHRLVPDDVAPLLGCC
jgi:hypothetical protein